MERTARIGGPLEVPLQSFHFAKMSLHVVEPFPITKIGIDLVLVVESVTETVVICFVSDPSVELIVVYIGKRALCGRLDSGGVRLF